MPINRGHLVMAISAIALLAASARAQTAAPGDLTSKAASIVSIAGENINGRPFTPGRGFLIGQNVIATDYEVIRNASKVYVKTRDGKKKEAKILGVDSRLAVAILSVSEMKVSPLALCVNDALESGEPVYIIAGADAIRREEIRDSLVIEGKRFLKMPGRVSPDSRGCPVFNSRGEVVAVAVADPTRGNACGFAVPASYLIKLGYIAIEGFHIGSIKYPSSDGEWEGKRLEAGAQPRFIRKSGSALQRDAVRRVIPIYPPLARQSRIVGLATIELTINEEGDVVAARAISGNQLLKDAALAAARGWKFPPTKTQGQPVRFIGTIIFNFAS